MIVKRLKAADLQFSLLQNRDYGIMWAKEAFRSDWSVGFVHPADLKSTELMGRYSELSGPLREGWNKVNK